MSGGGKSLRLRTDGFARGCDLWRHGWGAYYFAGARGHGILRAGTAMDDLRASVDRIATSLDDAQRQALLAAADQGPDAVARALLAPLAGIEADARKIADALKRRLDGAAP